jgi:cobalt-zinc-cadmium efflux system protein
LGHHHHHTGHHHLHPYESTKNIRYAFILNLTFTIIEIIGGLYTNSVAILSDALHDLGDSISLGLSWYFDKVSKRKRDAKYTYGYGRFSLLAAFINGVVLITGSLIIILIALPRVINPEQPDVQGMILLSILGIFFNGMAVFKVNKGKSMNERVVTLHLLEDVLGWVAVLIASIVMYFWHFPILDPLLSLLFASYILYSVIKNFRQTIRIFLQGKPDNINLRDFKNKLLQIKGFHSVHDLHIWTMDGAFYVMTLHMVVNDNIENLEISRIKNQVRETSHQNNIQHITVEVEFASEKCLLEDC